MTKILMSLIAVAVVATGFVMSSQDVSEGTLPKVATCSMGKAYEAGFSDGHSREPETPPIGKCAGALVGPYKAGYADGASKVVWGWER